MPNRDPDHLLKLIEDFVTAPTWGKARRIVETSPELLTEEADRLLDELIEENRQDPDIAGLLSDYREILRRCREEGIEAAFEEMLDMNIVEAMDAMRQRDDLDPQLRASLEELERQRKRNNPMELGLRALLGASTPAEVFQAAQDYPILLGDEVDGFFTGLIEKARSLKRHAIVLDFEGRREILRQMRGMGVGTGRETQAALSRVREQAAAMRARLEKDGPAEPAGPPEAPDGEGDAGGRPDGE